MGSDKFTVILELIVPQVLDEIRKQFGDLQISDINKFYSSKLYSELEREETKLWHYSPLKLKDMYCEELNKNYFDYPEEA